MRIKRILVALVSASVLFGVVACGESSGNVSEKAPEKSTEEVKEEVKKSEPPKIEQIEWNVDEGIVDGERTVGMSIANNTEFTLTGMKITFIERDDLTDEEKDAFCKDMQEKFGAKDDDMEQLKSEKIAMYASTEQVILPGDSVSNVNVYYYSGFYYMKSLDHYLLTTPDIAEISYVDGEKIYKEYYDFKNEKYSMDDKKEDAQYWTSTKLGTIIPKPEVPVLKGDGRDDDECFMFDAYGMTIDDFNAYIAKCKEDGFTVDSAEHEGFYSADNSEGYNIYAYFDDKDGNMSMTVKAPEKKEDVEKTTSAEESEDNSKEEKSEKKKKKSTKFRKTLDTYEEFFDDYVKFMKKYNNADLDDLDDMIDDYSKYLDEYSEKYAKLIEMANEDLSADDLAYYNEVMDRITEKLKDY